MQVNEVRKIWDCTDGCRGSVACCVYQEPGVCERRRMALNNDRIESAALLCRLVAAADHSVIWSGVIAMPTKPLLWS